MVTVLLLSGLPMRTCASDTTGLNSIVFAVVFHSTEHIICLGVDMSKHPSSVFWMDIVVFSLACKRDVTT